MWPLNENSTTWGAPFISTRRTSDREQWVLLTCEAALLVHRAERPHVLHYEAIRLDGCLEALQSVPGHVSGEALKHAETISNMYTLNCNTCPFGN